LGVLAPRAPNLRLGVKAPLPLRASSRESSPGALTHCPFYRLFIPEAAVFHFEPRGCKTKPKGVRYKLGVVLLWSSRAMHSRATQCTLLGHVTYFTSRKSCAVGPRHPRISSSSAPFLFSCGEWIKVVICVPLFKHVHSHDYLWRIPQVECRQVMPDDSNGQTARNNTTAAVCCELKKEVVPCEVLLFDRGEYQVTAGHFARTNFGFWSCVYRPPLVFQVVRSQISCLGAFSIAQRAAVRCVVRARRLACKAAGPHRECESGLGFNLVTGTEVQNCARW
jgi:hypothetical protein